MSEAVLEPSDYVGAVLASISEIDSSVLGLSNLHNELINAKSDLSDSKYNLSKLLKLQQTYLERHIGDAVLESKIKQSFENIQTQIQQSYDYALDKVGAITDIASRKKGDRF